MEFFNWLQIPQIFADYFGPNFSTLEEYIAFQSRMLYICIGVAAGLFLIGQILGGIGLYTMAKRAGVKHGWLGFVPIANTYLVGKLAGDATLFGKKMKNPGIYALVTEVIYVGFNCFITYLEAFLNNAAYYAPVYSEDGALKGWQFSGELVPANMQVAYNVCSILNYVVLFATLFFFCILFFALFRKYYARSPFLMTFLCAVLPARGFVLFAVRKNAPVDYAAYTRQRASQGGYTEGGFGGFGGGYGNPSAPEKPARPAAPEEPFSEFGSGKGSGEGGSAGGDNPFSDL